MALSVFALAVGVTPIPPEYAQNITVYHVNPTTFGHTPINMDTGDALGDLYFDLRSVDLPIECAKPDANPTDCQNQEVVAKNLGITRLTLEVDSRFYGEYARCNICVNGSDHHGHNNCTDGEYICGCGGFRTPEPCDERYVGKEDLTEHYKNSSRCKSSYSSNVDCWKSHVVAKTGGTWYSTLKGGYCGNPDAKACTWRVAGNVKRIAKNCSDESIYSTVEKADSANCFTQCGAGTGPGRNASEPCWIKCFYDTVLGPNSDSHEWTGEGGFEKAQLTDLWETPFATCPEV